MTCIITGCTLRRGDAWVGGDLHQVDNCMIFNAIKQNAFAAYWLYDGEPFYKKEVDMTACREVFEMYGVIAFEAKRAVLNQAARDYLEQR